jgi:hypothetical protein
MGLSLKSAETMLTRWIGYKDKLLVSTWCRGKDGYGPCLEVYLCNVKLFTHISKPSYRPVTACHRDWPSVSMSRMQLPSYPWLYYLGHTLFSTLLSLNKQIYQIARPECPAHRLLRHHSNRLLCMQKLCQSGQVLCHPTAHLRLAHPDLHHLVHLCSAVPALTFPLHLRFRFPLP